MNTFENVRSWHSELTENADENIIIYLVANFADLEEEREVTTE
jgi:GTPase SAR1 family protein